MMQDFRGLLLIFFFSMGCISLLGQEITVGTIVNQDTDEAYFLFAPLNNRMTYLINRQGEVVNQWESKYVPGLSAYLDEDGQLFRTGRVTDSTYINSGGAGGIIERFDWSGNLTWKYHYATRNVRQHHDFELMPNGNVLLIAWEWRSRAEAIENGRDPSTMGGESLWPDQLIEIRPMGNEGGEIVWEWHLWDHLIQDFDSGKHHFGVVGDHPELVDINYHENFSSDWIHGNSLEYNELLDQVAFSSRAFSEIWIIDHSTSILEAAGHKGGKMNRGGDILYRWGNPHTYKKGHIQDRILFGQHGLHWVYDQDDPTGQLLVFNNGNKRPGPDYASVEAVTLPVNDEGHYYILEDQVFLPREASWSFTDQDTVEMFAPLFSNVQMMENDHFLVCVGPRGTFIEYDQAGQMLWKYVSPVTESGKILRQGESIGDQYASKNSVFSISAYPPDYPGFMGRRLEGQGVIEGETITSVRDLERDQIIAYPNPVRDILFVDIVEAPATFILVDIKGSIVEEGKAPGPLEVRNLSPGMYFLKVGNLTRRIIKIQ